MLRYIAMTSISNVSSKSRSIRSVVSMCLARLNRRSQTSHKDGKAHFENNIGHKDHIQLFLTFLDTLFHVIAHQFHIHLTNFHFFTIYISAGCGGIRRIFYGRHHKDLPAQQPGSARLGPDRLPGLRRSENRAETPVGKPSSRAPRAS